VERVCADYAAVCADDDVEVVYNPLANALHGPWNLAAVRAGRHVLSEKPFAGNATEAREVADAARAAGVTVVEGFHYLHHPLMRRMHALLESGELGELRAVEAHLTMPAPPDGDPRWSYELAGGAVMDLGCYGLHAHRTLARWAGGEPRVVGAVGGERAGRPGVDEWLETDLAYPGGATGFVRCSMNAQWRVTLRLVGSSGEALAANFVLPHRDDSIQVRTKTGERTEHLGTRSSYLYQLEALRAHLRGGTPFPIGTDDAVATAELVDATYTAAGFSPRPSLATARAAAGPLPKETR
jgi:predicted dehydrogenase